MRAKLDKFFVFPGQSLGMRLMPSSSTCLLAPILPHVLGSLLSTHQPIQVQKKSFDTDWSPIYGHMEISSNYISSLCLRCASPSSLAGSPISSLPSLPSCSPSDSLPPDYNRQSGISSSSSLAPPPSLTVVGVGTLVVVLFIAASLTVNIQYFLSS